MPAGPRGDGQVLQARRPFAGVLSQAAMKASLRTSRSSEGISSTVTEANWSPVCACRPFEKKPRPGGHVGDPHQAAAERLVGLVQRVLHLLGEGLHPIRRRTGDEGRAGDDHVAFDVGKEAEADAATAQQADQHDHEGQRDRDDREAVVHRPGHQAAEIVVAEMRETGIPALPETPRGRRDAVP